MKNPDTKTIHWMHGKPQNAISHRGTPRAADARAKQDNQLNGCTKSLIIALREQDSTNTQTETNPTDAQKASKSLTNRKDPATGPLDAENI